MNTKVGIITSKLIAATALIAFLAACTTTGMTRGTPDSRRQAIQEMRQEVLAELYSIKPDTRGQIADASGYAVFSNANINLIFASFGGGIGVVRSNANNADTYMRMGEVGIGIGAGVKDFRAVFVFHNAQALERFMDVGISVGGQADAAAKAGDLGAAVGGEAIVDNITVYQLTQSGLALQATVKGTRYWQDADLN
jgi:lipid-binding SYLF domain-containing protein